ncbi:MAG: hypothetical protein JEZ00_07990 [Anaerolineaceae bacterium]|nr:hypothetical protein [Anaerolineaceae bacterium]
MLDFIYNFDIKRHNEQRKIYSRLTEREVFEIARLALQNLKVDIIQKFSEEGFISGFMEMSLFVPAKIVTINISRSEKPPGSALVILCEYSFNRYRYSWIKDRFLGKFVEEFFRLEQNLEI